MSLRNRIGAAAGIAVALTVIGVAITVYVAVRSELYNQVDTALNDRARPFATGSGPHGDGDLGRNGAGQGSGGNLAQAAPPRGGNPGAVGGVDPGGGQGAAAAASRAPFGGPSGHLQFVSPSGRVTAPPDEGATIPASASAKRIAARGTGRELTDTHVRGVHLRVLTVGRGSQGAIQVARPLKEEDDVLRNLVIVLVIIGAAGIAVAGLLGLFVARTALAPIARFTRRTEKLTGDPDLSLRLEVEGKDELARLARSFNATLDALESSVASQRHLVADASHELRTPIASLRANVQTLEEAHRLSPEEARSLHADIVEELDELTALVGDVVELARDPRTSAEVDDVRLDEIAAAQVERAQRRAGNLTFETDLEPTIVSGQPDRINRAVSNLLDNARKWSPPDGTIQVSLLDGTLAVRDHGPGFDEVDLPHVFDRFYRAGAARSMPGSGLGLAIVRQAAMSHGGFARAENAPDGGALLTVGFGPAVRPSSEAEPALRSS
ncbi:MAG TPA: HAMP domain-containing sensor histidine kinase [Solirubrobacteraceae bacterium]|jgi:two-component system sensor histidine kinase MprB|nr:HAMP domain-containing sensor histidine kinase [Solirubrobacteraceae bacterium]